MKKLILTIIGIFITFSVNALDIHYLDLDGSPHVLNVPTNYSAWTHVTISSKELGLPNCESGPINAYFVLDKNEQNERIYIETATPDSNWDNFEMYTPAIVYYKVPFAGHMNSCANITFDIKSLGNEIYRWYKDDNNQCVLAKTRDEALCTEGCKDCIAVNGN